MRQCIHYSGKMAVALILIVMLMANILPAQGRPGKAGRAGFWKQLTEKQREAVKAKRDSLWDKGTAREDIHAEIHTMLKEYGVELPARNMRSIGRKGFAQHREFMNLDLTEEQRKELREKIRATIKETLLSYGVDMPEDFGKRAQIWENMSEEQRTTMRSKIRKMRKEGATREEIREEVQKNLKK